MELFKILIFLSLGFLLCNLISCKKDTCEETLCQNGAICSSGACQCPTGYSGELCQIDDLCVSQVCLNGSTCERGVCQCPPGYSGVQCEILDPCFNVNCQNGGTCNNGACDCPVGYSGADCSDRLNATSLTITQIDVLNFPEKASNGVDWDYLGDPDIFISLTLGSTANSSGRITNTRYDVNTLPLTYTLNPTKEVTSLNNYWTIGLYDEDGSSSTFMGGIYFIPYRSNYPEKITVSSASMGFEIYVTWNF